jgi:Trp operon repressor
MEELLNQRWIQLREIHERLEDINKTIGRGANPTVKLKQLEDDVRLWRDAAKQEFDGF